VESMADEGRTGWHCCFAGILSMQQCQLLIVCHQACMTFLVVVATGPGARGCRQLDWSNGALVHN
jgi:hypothetical protein